MSDLTFDREVYLSEARSEGLSQAKMQNEISEGLSHPTRSYLEKVNRVSSLSISVGHWRAKILR